MKLYCFFPFVNMIEPITFYLLSTIGLEEEKKRAVDSQPDLTIFARTCLSKFFFFLSSTLFKLINTNNQNHSFIKPFLSFSFLFFIFYEILSFFQNLEFADRNEIKWNKMKSKRELFVCLLFFFYDTLEFFFCISFKSSSKPLVFSPGPTLGDWVELELEGGEWGEFWGSSKGRSNDFFLVIKVPIFSLRSMKERGRKNYRFSKIK